MIPDGLREYNGNSKWSLRTQLTGSNMELYGKSTDTKPTTNIKTGTTFFEIDTKVVYIFDGSEWVVL